MTSKKTQMSLDPQGCSTSRQVLGAGMTYIKKSSSLCTTKGFTPDGDHQAFYRTIETQNKGFASVKQSGRKGGEKHQRNSVQFSETTATVYGQAAVTYRFPSDHRSQAPSSGVSTWMGDNPGTPRAVGNTWCTGHMAKPRPEVGRVCSSHHQNTPQFTAKNCDWSLDLSEKKKEKKKKTDSSCQQVSNKLL